jgi:hypothetical protein
MILSREQVVGRVADHLVAQRRGHPLRVAVDGITASGKTTLARALAAAVRQRGRPVIQLSLDGLRADKVVTAAADAVLVVDGSFLQQEELAALWDEIVFVDTSFAVAREVDPGAGATIVIGNDDVEHPVLRRIGRPGGQHGAAVLLRHAAAAAGTAGELRQAAGRGAGNAARFPSRWGHDHRPGHHRAERQPTGTGLCGTPVRPRISCPARSSP